MGYAWSTILTGEKTIALGDSVSAKDVGGKDALAQLVEAGSVREAEYPVPADSNESPMQYQLRKLREAADALQAEADLSFANFALGGVEAPAEAEEPVEEITK